MRFRRRNKYSGLFKNMISLVLGMFIGLFLANYIQPKQTQEPTEFPSTSVTEQQVTDQPTAETTDTISAYKEQKRKATNKQAKKRKPHPLTKDDKISLIAKTIWCENNRSEMSMRLTMSVIYNRANNKTLEGAYKEVSKPGQFECFRMMANKSPRNKDNRYRTAEEIVMEFVRGEFTPLIDARYFYNPSLVKRKPSFAVNRPLLLSFENHDYH